MPAALGGPPSPAVGEKNSDDEEGRVSLNLLFRSGLSALRRVYCPSFSRDMFEPCPIPVYTPFPAPVVEGPWDAPGARRNVLLSPWALAASAERRTFRLILHAAKPRQRRTVPARKPSAAPTAMNTVPSGRVDFCMYGALAV